MSKQAKKTKVVVALSGGVDSSVAAAKLKEEGYDLIAVFYELWAPERKEGKTWENNCCSLDAFLDAQRVAKQLDIPLVKANIAKEFKKTVVDHFLDEYKQGRTPNPCIVCNTELRFGLMLDRALKDYSADYLATGHYAIRDHVDSWRVSEINLRDKQHRLFLSSDAVKDQGYFLYRLSQAQLGRVLFPVGGLTKKQVRVIAEKKGLPTASKHDSQEICFVPRGGVSEFLQKHLKTIPGKIKNVRGDLLGNHNGTELFTHGQRRGLGSLGTDAHFVVDKDLEKGEITVTSDKKDPCLYASLIILDQVSLISDKSLDGETIQARGRHSQKSFKAQLFIKASYCTVEPLEPMRVVAPGQSIVFMKDDEILGGGVVKKNITRATLTNDHDHKFEPIPASR